MSDDLDCIVDTRDDNLTSVDNQRGRRFGMGFDDRLDLPEMLGVLLVALYLAVVFIVQVNIFEDLQD